MWKVKVFGPNEDSSEGKGKYSKPIAIHSYDNEDEARMASYALHNHPLFGYKTIVYKA